MRPSESDIWDSVCRIGAPSDVNVAGFIVPLTDTAKLLCVTIDRHLTFDSHVQNVMQVRILLHTCFEAHSLIPFHRHGETVASAFVNSRLDYANSVLYNTSSVNMLKLQ